MKAETIETVTAVAQKTTIGGSLMALFGGITAAELATLRQFIASLSGVTI